ncbi:hypothetical protein KRR40_29745 [Niabella defluvii]|nr:hypothetical protein KRR40_29745 [Niabella sp. I65]
MNAWKIEKNDSVFTGNQKTGADFYFYAISNYKIRNIETVKEGDAEVSVVNYIDKEVNDPLEVKVAFPT